MATTMVEAVCDSSIDSIDIRNVMVSAQFPHRLDLDEIAASLRNVEFEPKYRGIIYRMDEPEAVLVMYSKGTIVAVGCKSKEVSIEAIRKTVELIREKRITVDSDPVIQVHNIVATVTTGSSINIELASMKLEYSVYEPEQFPGLIYKPTPGISISLFSQGKITVTGARTESEVEAYAQETVSRLAELGCMEE
ncbi:MAG: hypothetical protein R6V83_00545 [Candidatus Thorarchaeota archaeon]